MVRGHRFHARCGCAGASAPFSLAGTERVYERARPFVIKHLFLDCRLDFPKKSLQATAVLDFERVAPDAEHLELDAVGFEIVSVRSGTGRQRTRASYDYDGERLTIEVGHKLERGQVEIRYRARPRRGLYFLEPDDHVPERPRQVWTQCQDEDARHFLPCHDKPHVKMTSELRVEVPNGYVALSNGDLIKRSRPRGKPWRYHFRMAKPHASYLLTLVAGRFDVVEDRPARGDGAASIPVAYYVPPGRVADAQRSFSETPRMIELFAKLTGVPFPWSRYSQVVVSDFIFGGMENTTATTLYEHVLLDERAALDVTSNDLVAHELAHQWFGDWVTCRDWSHAWLNEGFATFFEHIEREDRLGRDEYDWGIVGDLDAYLAEANSRYARPVVCRDYAEPIDLFDRHLYEKGCLVLHMLRRELADTLFWRGVKQYLSQHAGGIVETNDLQRALEQTSGRSFERFFDQWVYRPGHPVLKVKISWEAGLLTVHAKQTQKVGDTAVFAYELEVEVESDAGERTRHKKSVSEVSDALVIRMNKRPHWVAFDPDLRVVGDITVEAPADLLRRQLSSGSSARIRWSAAEALARRDDPPSIEALGKSLVNAQEAWMVRVEAARALGRVRGRESFSWLQRGLDADHPKVRRAVASALGSFRTADAARLLVKRARQDESYLVEAESAGSLGRTRQPGVVEELLAVVDRPSWADVLRAGALDGLGSTRDEAAVSHVLAHTRYGVPTRGRRAAIAALPKLTEGRKVREHLEDLLDDGNPYVRVDVVAALQSLGDGRARPALRHRLEHELDGRVARRIREALRDLGDSAERERKRLSDELEGLRNELSELKTRMSQLEGKRAVKATAQGPQRARSAPSSLNEAKQAPSGTGPGKVAGKGSKGTAREGRESTAAASPKRRKLLDERGTRTR